MNGTLYKLEVRPNIPNRFSRLEEIANDLYYSWSSQVRSLFMYLNTDLWHACGHNPKMFLRRIAQQRLDEVAHDHVFIESYNRALSEYDTYMQEPETPVIGDSLQPGRDLAAYFCMEFGFHESLPIYSGGLGILAGDYCKAASDLNVPLVAIGLLYHHGYFTQEIDSSGNQIARYLKIDFDELLVTPVLDENGEEIRVGVPIYNRAVQLRVWKAKAGRVDLFLLDSDVPENAEEDRMITYQLYGGDQRTRICQEIVLGIGGVKALRSMNRAPTVWHINEGHAAFLVIERCRELIVQGTPFDVALELVAAAIVFTTHTPVAAGHDVFDHGLVTECAQGLIAGLGIEADLFFALGANPGTGDDFNMTALALRGSRWRNGVSRIHGRVASEMASFMWPEVPTAENPIRYVTNGVHLSSYLSSMWRAHFDLNIGGAWRNQALNEEFWSCVNALPDYAYWSTRQSLKAALLRYVRGAAQRQFQRNGLNQVQIDRLTHMLTPRNTDMLIIGFARRFATYKRATLIFHDPERLARLLNDADRPVLILIAGKAHPHDGPGQHLIHELHSLSMRREFLGKVVLIEDYDLALARWLVSGVDVWLNTPEYPLEASGTSGQKAGMNGVINLSVLDGWWGEGYDGRNGWAISPVGVAAGREERERIESQTLLDLLEEEVIPLFFRRDGNGYSEGWVRKSKASMQSILPRFNAGRMVRDYVQDHYLTAQRYAQKLAQRGARGARELADWKHRIRELWPSVSARRLDEYATHVQAGTALPIRVLVQARGLSPSDLSVECLLSQQGDPDRFAAGLTYPLRVAEEVPAAEGELLFSLDLQPELAGLQYYKIRIYPFHPLLNHPLEMGCMRWL